MRASERLPFDVNEAIKRLTADTWDVYGIKPSNEDEWFKLADKITADGAKVAKALTTPAASGEGERLNGKTPWEFACEWYDEQSIVNSVTTQSKGAFNERQKIPPDVTSEAFGKYLTHEYRLAMRKGIEIAQRDNARLTTALREAESYLAREGYRRCDIAACNCGSWHGGNAGQRLQEITEALIEADCQPRQKTILVAVCELAQERDDLRTALREAQQRAERLERELNALREGARHVAGGTDSGCMASTDLSVPSVGHGIRLLRAAIQPAAEAIIAAYDGADTIYLHRPECSALRGKSNTFAWDDSAIVQAKENRRSVVPCKCTKVHRAAATAFAAGEGEG